MISRHLVIAHVLAIILCGASSPALVRAASSVDFFATLSLQSCRAQGLMHEWIDPSNALTHDYSFVDMPFDFGDHVDAIKMAFDVLFDNTYPPFPWYFRPNEAWWTGDQDTIAGLANYPPFVQPPLGQFDESNDNYAVRVQGQIWIAADGDYRFADASSRYTYLAVDPDGNAVTPPIELINDAEGTDIHSAGAVAVASFQNVGSGDWRDLEFNVVAELDQEDAGILYWDGGDSTMPFPEFPFDPIDDPAGFIPRDALRSVHPECNDPSVNLTEEELDERPAFIVDPVGAARFKVLLPENVGLNEEFGDNGNGFQAIRGYELLDVVPLASNLYEVEVFHPDPNLLNPQNDYAVIFQVDSRMDGLYAAVGDADSFFTDITDSVETEITDIRSACIDVTILDQQVDEGVIPRQLVETHLGDVECFEALLLIDGINSPTPPFSPLDCNLDGVLDAGDLVCVTAETRDPTLSALNLFLGDFDGNGSVEFLDFVVLAGNFGKEGVGYMQGDADVNGTVGFEDFLALASNFGQQSETAAVPEPSGLALLLMSIIGVSWRRS